MISKFLKKIKKLIKTPLFAAIVIILIAASIIGYTTYFQPAKKVNNTRTNEQPNFELKNNQLYSQLSSENILILINQEREKNGLNKLTMSSNLNDFAATLSSEFVSQGRISNDIFQNLAKNSQWSNNYSYFFYGTVVNTKDSYMAKNSLMFNQTLKDGILNKRFSSIGFNIRTPNKNIANSIIRFIKPRNSLWSHLHQPGTSYAVNLWSFTGYPFHANVLCLYDFSLKHNSI